jgi:hypothetical protein
MLSSQHGNICQEDYYNDMDTDFQVIMKFAESNLPFARIMDILPSIVHSSPGLHFHVVWWHQTTESCGPQLAQRWLVTLVTS